MCTPTLFPKATDWTQAAHSLWSQGEGRGTLAPSRLHPSLLSLSLAIFQTLADPLLLTCPIAAHRSAYDLADLLSLTNRDLDDLLSSTQYACPRGFRHYAPTDLLSLTMPSLI